MHLPAEILLAIANQLLGLDQDYSLGPNQRHHLNLLRVCRYWNNVLFDLVYGSLQIRDTHARPLTELALANPRVQHAVRKLYPKWHNHGPQRERVVLTDPVINRVGQLAESLEEQQEWFDALETLDADAWFALLVVSLPNLNVLSSSGNYGALWMALAASRAVHKKSALQQLTTLKVEIDDSNNNYAAQLFLPFFHLPCLRTVDLNSVNDYNSIERSDDQPVMHAASGTSPVESLTFRCSSNGRHGMEELIRSCANLKRFVYEHEDQISWGEIYRVFRPRRFYRPLSAHTHCLEVLHLNDYAFNGDSDDESDDEDDGPQFRDRWFGSLADFSRLWDVHMRVDNLFAIHPMDIGKRPCLKDSLPRSLKCLCLSDWEVRHAQIVTHELVGLLAHREETFPSLEKLKIISSYVEETTRNAESRFRPIKEACVREGMEFGVFVVNREEPVF